MRELPRSVFVTPDINECQKIIKTFPSIETLYVDVDTEDEAMINGADRFLVFLSFSVRLLIFEHMNG
jgi:hypothetical protein